MHDDRTEKLHALEERIGEISTAALRKGGEPLLDRTDAALGVALRHSERIAKGFLRFTPQIEREMRASIERAQELLND